MVVGGRGKAVAQLWGKKHKSPPDESVSGASGGVRMRRSSPGETCQLDAAPFPGLLLLPSDLREVAARCWPPGVLAALRASIAPSLLLASTSSRFWLHPHCAAPQSTAKNKTKNKIKTRNQLKGKVAVCMTFPPSRSRVAARCVRSTIHPSGAPTEACELRACVRPERVTLEKGRLLDHVSQIRVSEK